MKKSFRFVLCAGLAVALSLTAAAAFAAPPPPGHHEYGPGPHYEGQHKPHYDPHPGPKPGPHYDPPPPHGGPHYDPPPPHHDGPHYAPPPPPHHNEGPVVYAMPQGQGYHRWGCKFIHGRRGVLRMSMEEARRRGYRPCRTCF